MPIDVFLVVLAAAALHAGWNTMLKLKARPGGGGPVDPLVSTLMLGIAASLVSVAAMPVVGLPERGAWLFALGSAVIHVAYYLLVGAAYRVADLSAVYPITRGTAPMGSALLAAVLLGERLAPAAWVGVAAICAGVVGMAAVALRRGGLSWVGLGFAGANAGVVTLYTLVDGQGARLSGNPAGYTLAMEALCGPLLLPVLAVALRGQARGGRVGGGLRAVGAALVAALSGGRWWRAVLGACMSVGAYAAALWAMTRAPIGAVAALRETSVLLGVLLGAVVLREHVGVSRWVAAAVIVAGAMLVRMG